ncbi:uncharacterized protein K452DRAFT_291307 [Aplosporella prunicola CBS 121167]|uniref:BTB domain-containing protein n=1 Tax=Aplosporella prunicola CBS 121167 TaxID=1176127 RepID=A0A6A6B0J9_9PEZI|nr:uncharacterized protein K452DRAFT_291307 [Aplosporella prunicola CBS 121167]KAF2137702.1 hypothetical protein K452DRAFT_291307 [Aplosporella prunicola CBS 121167]
MASHNTPTPLDYNQFEGLQATPSIAQLPLLENCDPEGDIRLTAPLITTPGVKTQKSFIVSSNALRLACDPWNKMLAPDSPFAEKGKIGQGELSFPDDNAAPLAILLHIAHLNFDKVPQNMNFRSLLDLSILTDKYGATKLVRPWIKTWIADEFGRLASFQELAVHLVKEVRVTANGRCVTQKGRILDPSGESCQLPPDIIESILGVRQQVIQSLFDIFQRFIKEFAAVRSQNIYGTRCDCSSMQENQDDKRQCDILAFGSLTLSLHQAGLSLEKSWVDKKDRSITELSTKLLGIEVVMRGHRGYSSTCKNWLLKTELQQSINMVLSNIPSPVKDIHRRHLQRQAAACGAA